MQSTTSATVDPHFDPDFSSKNRSPISASDLLVLPPSLPIPIRRASRKSSRPSTSSSAEGKPSFLPCVQSAPSADSSITGTPQLDMIETVPEEQPEESDLEWLPSPFAPSTYDDAEDGVDMASRPSALPSQDSQERIEAEYDWATFIEAYAAGRWDPHRTPKPPRSALSVTYTSPLSLSPSVRHLDLQTSRSPTTGSKVGAEDGQLGTCPSETSGAPALTPSPSSSSSSKKPQMSIPLNLPPTPSRLRNSFADFRSAVRSQLSGGGGAPGHVTSPDIATHAATIRLAAARVSLAPLALPSPEHELTDPFRGAHVVIPGSHPPVYDEFAVLTPGGTRRSRLGSFWEGTQDVEDEGEGRSETTEVWEDGEYGAFGDVGCGSGGGEEAPPSASFTLSHVPPASAPALSELPEGDTDYFGDLDGLAPLPQTAKSGSGSGTGTADSSTTATHVAEWRQSLPVTRRPSLQVSEVVTVPAIPRRVCLTRQTSSPLPGVGDNRPTPTRLTVDGVAAARSVRAAKEEQIFEDVGYLVAPNPPDEMERRRALYRFNVWNTGHDQNFDRIVHLAKLVFNAKIVMIALLDGTEQWSKSESGMGFRKFLPRASTFCAHTILHRGDEPTVVLNASEDWRFAQNPHVTGPPYVKFYAAAPLRTHDGYNIGTLALFDDSPHTEFSPRQRHTLKEFAAIVMRELELWRDKIQLRIRDRIQNSMEEFTRECLEIDEQANSENAQELFSAASMEKIYERAARLVKRTLDVEGACVLDVSQREVVENMSAEASVSIACHSADSQTATTCHGLTTQEYALLSDFFTKYPDGKISEGIVPTCLRSFLPTRIQYALMVPIFNIDKRPFALLCAYTDPEQKKRFLEGHELSYLRAIGVIILSAVLKRRMIMADKAKGLFISNISHELRTPLHGILAAAEMLAESSLNHSQISFLQTVQACGTSLVETVNHVLDFTKLSGNSKAGGVEHVIVPTKVNLVHLVEEAVEGCWIGYKARMATLGESEIGSVYSPPKDPGQCTIALASRRKKHVETVVDIGHRSDGWVLKVEKAGIRRILMNLFGNSLKFTKDGFVHVQMRELPSTPEDEPGKIKIELIVQDTGKGISQTFLKNQLFHPFSQENPLQTGTGLGLAIVNSIVRSPSVGGNIDVQSVEGTGTVIVVHFTAETLGKKEESNLDVFELDDEVRASRTVSLVGFDDEHKGIELFRKVICSYLETWWKLQIAPDASSGDIVILNETLEPVKEALERQDPSRPFILLSSARGDAQLMEIVGRYEQLGGFCRLIYKPGGPSRLRSALKQCFHALAIGPRTLHSSVSEPQGLAMELDGMTLDPNTRLAIGSGVLPRRNSEEQQTRRGPVATRPGLGARAHTIHPLTTWKEVTATAEEGEASGTRSRRGSLSYSPLSPGSENPDSPTIPVGGGGTLLRTSIGSAEVTGAPRVLVVEDNSILRSLLTKWLNMKGYDYREAVDGRQGVDVFERDGRFDVVLLDLSMPVLDGVGATSEMRKIESSRNVSEDGQSTKILALTGMSSLNDKRRAFEAGVDGYLVKPVAFKTLDEMFHKLGVS